MLIVEIISLIILVAVAIATALLEQKQEKRWYVFASLQLVGLIALLGLIPYPIIAGITYIAALSVILSTNNKGSRNLSATPIYTMGFLSVFYTLLFVELKSKNVHIGSFVEDLNNILPRNTGGVWLFAYIASLASMVWFNIWTKKHSILVYALVVLGAYISFIALAFYLALTNFTLL